MIAALMLVTATLQPADLWGIWTVRVPALATKGTPYTLVGRWTDGTQSGDRSIRYGETTGGATMLAYQDPGEPLNVMIYNDKACLWMEVRKQSRAGGRLRGVALLRGGNCEDPGMVIAVRFNASRGGKWP